MIDFNDHIFCHRILSLSQNWILSSGLTLNNLYFQKMKEVLRILV